MSPVYNRVDNATYDSQSQFGIDKIKGFIFVGYYLTQTNSPITILTKDDTTISIEICL